MSKHFSQLLSLKHALLVFILIPLLINGQNEPSWMKQMVRNESYPASVFITGFAQDGINTNETAAKALERVKDMARANLTKSIITSVESVSQNYMQSVIKDGNESFSESFESQTKTTTNIIINGVKVESFAGENNIVSAFAFANRYEIIGYYTANLNMTISQIEGLISSAKELEAKNEKVKAKNEFNKSIPLFNNIKEAQGVLSAIDANISDEKLKMTHTMSLYNEVVQANARLAQGVYVFIEANELLFGEKTSAIENLLKATLAENGCSFIDNQENADWRIIIDANSREFNESNSIYFSYVDATVQLFKASTNKNVYQNEFTQKGAHGHSFKMAGKDAYKKISSPISEKLLNWINN